VPLKFQYFKVLLKKLTGLKCIFVNRYSLIKRAAITIKRHQMKFIILFFTLNFVFSSCQQKQQNPVSKNKTPENKIIGTWKMIYAEIKEKDSLQIKDMGKSDFVKIINATHFAFFNQDLENPAGFYGGGGTYKLQNNNYTETLNYTSIETIRGHNFPFTIEIKGDTLIQFGLEEIKEANIKRYIVEKYIRVLD